MLSNLQNQMRTIHIKFVMLAYYEATSEGNYVQDHGRALRSLASRKYFI